MGREARGYRQRTMRHSKATRYANAQGIREAAREAERIEALGLVVPEMTIPIPRIYKPGERDERRAK